MRVFLEERDCIGLFFIQINYYRYSSLIIFIIGLQFYISVHNIFLSKQASVRKENMGNACGKREEKKLNEIEERRWKQRKRQRLFKKIERK